MMSKSCMQFDALSQTFRNHTVSLTQHLWVSIWPFFLKCYFLGMQIRFQLLVFPLTEFWLKKWSCKFLNTTPQPYKTHSFSFFLSSFRIEKPNRTPILFHPIASHDICLPMGCCRQASARIKPKRMKRQIFSQAECIEYEDILEVNWLEKLGVVQIIRLKNRRESSIAMVSMVLTEIIQMWNIL